MKTKVLFLILAFFFVPRLVMASDGLNLVISPLPINLISAPGATVSAQIKIKNGGNTSEHLQVGLMKFSAYGDEGKPRLTDREKGDDYFDWMTFSENDFVLNPGEWKTITAYITIPNEAAFGYYYAVTFSRKDETIPGSPLATKVTGATATLILLEVRVPNAIRNVDVLEFSTPQKIYEFLPASFNIKLKNSGNVHVAPRGNIFIDGMGQKDIAILNINDLKGNVLPNSNRVFESKWTDGFPYYEQQVVNNSVVTDHAGREQLKLKWNFSQIDKLRWGKYSANMLLVYDDGQRDVPIEGRLEFWIIPWRILGVVLVVVVLIIAGLLSLLKNPINSLVSKFKK